MSDPKLHFRYVARDANGRRARGVLAAIDEGSAYARLRADGLTPLTLRSAPAGDARPAPKRTLSDREVADLVSDLSQLLAAGADIRTALSILGARHRPQVAAVCAEISREIAGGGALDETFAARLGRQGALIGALVAAGEAAGDLPGALARAADLIESGIRLRGKLGAVLAYPSFVLVSTLAAVLALLLGVIPSLAPLVQDSAGGAPKSLRLMIAASELLRTQLPTIGVILTALVAAALLAWRSGALGRIVDAILLNGPVRRTMGSLVFGAFAIAVGGMLMAGAPMSETLRLAVRSVRSPGGRARLEPVVASVRQGRSLSYALQTVSGLPAPIARLAAVGEETGSLGAMLLRAGRMEENAAVARIERLGQLLGPLLILGLGVLVGTLMAGLLSGVSDLGESALQ